MSTYVRPLLVAIATCAAVLSGCESPSWHTPPRRDGLVEATVAAHPGASLGERLWTAHCAICHGKTGDGDGFNAKLLPTPPPTARELVERYGSEPSKPHLATAIARGSSGSGRGPWCPAWRRTLGEEGTASVAAHVRALATRTEPQPSTNQ
jgi:mono/diheme cytochrome c family protein